jgi:hypothetical protein
MAVPTKTSRTKWLAVTTTATTIDAGMITANARSGQRLLARKTTMPSSTLQPAWKLGMAAYSLTSEDGRTVR